MKKSIQISHKIIAWVFILAVGSLQSESTKDPFPCFPPPVKKNYWKASIFAGGALLAVAGGIVAIFLSGGGETPHRHRNRHCDGNSRDDSKHHRDGFHHRSGFSCPNTNNCACTATADCMAGACIPHPAKCQRDPCSTEHHRHSDCNVPCEITLNPPTCCATNCGIVPF